MTSTFLSGLAVLKNIATTSLESIVINAIPSLEDSLAPTPRIKKTSVKRELPPKGLNHWRKLIETINSRWLLTMRSITINQVEVPQIVNNRTPSDLFSALSPFQHLRCLKIQQCAFFPCDKGIYLLALACPNITTLHLPLECVTAYAPPATEVSNNTISTQSGLSGTSMTVVALLLLCDLCPRLEDLQIGLGVTDLPPFSNTTVRSHYLARLSISSHSTIRACESHILNIARHVDRLFPHLKEIVSHPLYGAEIWDRIRPIIEAYKKVRLDDAIRRSPSETSQ
ncbi:hypothetical protein BDZ94DRAFT_1261873 [Collybia nuda]|uniref:Uncharacterized protein n=1 Tax=Collybia nuda TaxID=64659 RepID=A0A9P5Y5Y1_9AGAR|nr:hypothetical protein BDZ94DRAFT_1261873 [Collybia nuda]